MRRSQAVVSMTREVAYCCGTVPNSLTPFCTPLDPFQVLAMPIIFLSDPVPLVTSTAGVRSFFGAWCEREKRDGMVLGYGCQS